MLLPFSHYYSLDQSQLVAPSCWQHTVKQTAIKMATYIPATDVCYRSVVWLSRSCIVLKRLQISTISYAYNSPMSLSDHSICLTAVNPFFPKFCLKLTNFRWFKRRRHSMANCGRIVRERTMLTMDSLPETTIALFSTPSPKWGPQCTLKDQLHDACCHLSIWYKISTRFLLLHTNYIAFCHIILVLVFLEICLINSLQQLQTSLLTHCSSTSTVVCGQSLLVDLSTTHLNWQRCIQSSYESVSWQWLYCSSRCNQWSSVSQYSILSHTSMVACCHLSYCVIWIILTVCDWLMRTARTCALMAVTCDHRP